MQETATGEGALDGHALRANPAQAATGQHHRRGLLSLRTSPLARKIVTFNLIALNILAAGILYLDASRDSLVQQRAVSLVAQAELIADVVAARGAVSSDSLTGSDLRGGIEVFVFDVNGTLLARAQGDTAPLQATPPTPLSDGLNWVWSMLSAPFDILHPGMPEATLDEKIREQVARGQDAGTQIDTTSDAQGGTFFTVITPITQGAAPLGTVAVASAAGEIDMLVRGKRERMLQMFLIATLVSVGLSLVLASTIANPIADLAAAAEAGRSKGARRMAPARVRIPDLTARPDEIGRLSGALRGMVSALYRRNDSNEAFAADVAHEIKNPLASLRSAIGTLRVVRDDAQRAKMLDVIDHDVQRLDRLVSDIANASRLDSELVKEEEQAFDLLKLVRNLATHYGQEAQAQGVTVDMDLPEGPMMIQGLEPRLAQVFVNLITNALSFCEDGDAIRIWVRKRENRVLVVVEDTGPGVPEEATLRIFERFYSQRTGSHFGQHSGLGLAISKQIVEAHGGVIWAENIHPTAADITSEPAGARFVVGLPL